MLTFMKREHDNISNTSIYIPQSKYLQLASFLYNELWEIRYIGQYIPISEELQEKFESGCKIFEFLVKF